MEYILKNKSFFASFFNFDLMLGYLNIANRPWLFGFLFHYHKW